MGKIFKLFVFREKKLEDRIENVREKLLNNNEESLEKEILYLENIPSSKFSSITISDLKANSQNITLKIQVWWLHARKEVFFVFKEKKEIPSNILELFSKWKKMVLFHAPLISSFYDVDTPKNKNSKLAKIIASTPEFHSFVEFLKFKLLQLELLQKDLSLKVYLGCL